MGTRSGSTTTCTSHLLKCDMAEMPAVDDLAKQPQKCGMQKWRIQATRVEPMLQGTPTLDDVMQLADEVPAEGDDSDDDVDESDDDDSDDDESDDDEDEAGWREGDQVGVDPQVKAAAVAAAKAHQRTLQAAKAQQRATQSAGTHA